MGMGMSERKATSQSHDGETSFRYSKNETMFSHILFSIVIYKQIMSMALQTLAFCGEEVEPV